MISAWSAEPRRRSLASTCVWCVSVGMLLFAAPPAEGQEMRSDSVIDPLAPVPVPVRYEASDVPLDPFAARAPFGPGEHLVYKVKVGIFSVGEGYMSVVGVEDVRDNQAYRVEMGIRGGLGPAKVRDTYQTWFDVSTLQSWRFIQDIDDPGYESYRHYELFPERMRWERQDNDEAGELGSALPLDDISIIYFIRTLPLEVGRSYTLNRYFKETGNPLVVHVLRREQRETEGVVYNTIVVSPEIRTSGMFAEGGKAEIHFTDDERRIPVYVKTDIPNFPGSLTLHLRSVQEGFPLNPESRMEATDLRIAREGSGGR
jgi:hypothetical protein